MSNMFTRVDGKVLPGFSVGPNVAIFGQDKHKHEAVSLKRLYFIHQSSKPVKTKEMLLKDFSFLIYKILM